MFHLVANLGSVIQVIYLELPLKKFNYQGSVFLNCVLLLPGGFSLGKKFNIFGMLFFLALCYTVIIPTSGKIQSFLEILLFGFLLKKFLIEDLHNS